MSDAGKPQEERKYWLNLFTGGTWDAFRNSGATTCGFTRRWRRAAEAIQVGDILVCYLTGVMRWVGVLEVTRGLHEGSGPEWTYPDFPLLFDVRSEVVLDADFGLPMSELEGQVDFFEKNPVQKGYKQFLRNCPKRFRKTEDAELICRLLQELKQTPQSRPVSQTLLYRKPRFQRRQYRAGH